MRGVVEEVRSVHQNPMLGIGRPSITRTLVAEGLEQMVWSLSACVHVVALEYAHASLKRDAPNSAV